MITIVPLRRTVLALVAGLVLMGAVLAAAPSALAQQEQGSLDIQIADIEITEEGETVLTVDLDGVAPEDVRPGMFTVLEDGEPAGDLSVTSSSDRADPEPRSVMLAMDTSDSTLGESRDQSIQAAKDFAATVTERGVEVGVLAFYGQVDLLLQPTGDLAEINATLDDMPGGFGTALNDAMIVAGNAMGTLQGDTSIVLFSDGGDAGSTGSLADAINSIVAADVPVTAVALETNDADFDALDEIANRSGGRVIQVDGAENLQAAFQDVADELGSQYVISFPSSGNTGQLEFEVAVERGGSRTSASLPYINNQGLAPESTPRVVEVESPGLFANQWLATAAVGAAGLGIALVLLGMFVPIGDRQVARNLEAAIGGEGQVGEDSPDLSPTTAAMSRRAIELIERIPKPEGYDATLQARIDKAAWPLRASEFTTMRALIAVAMLGIGWSLVHVVVGALLAAVGWVLPNLVLGFRLNARQNKFMDQLPDTLQMLSGSLKAGYGVLQAIDTVVKEAQEPTKSEFQRVLSEARLGLPLEDSLADMAERIGTDDFRWVAVSINIQRRVGGNLAQLLETVAMTLRERAATRRQIKALSAEGRLSAYILVALPFGLGGYMLLVNPSYLSTLGTTGIGQIMLAGAFLLMCMGIYWMKNIIEIDV